MSAFKSNNILVFVCLVFITVSVRAKCPLLESMVCSKLGSCPVMTCKLTDDCRCKCENEHMCKPDVFNMTSVIEIPSAARTYNVCEETYTLRPEHERTCGNIDLTCTNGRCIQQGRSYYCECDTGSSGHTCTDKCCKQCGEHGSCKVHYMLGEVCMCVTNYTGEFCEQIIHPPTPSSKIGKYQLYIVR